VTPQVGHFCICRSGDPIKWMGSIQWQVDDLIYSIFNLMYLSAYQEFGAVVSAFL